MAKIIVEVLNRLGHCSDRYKFDQFPVSIGRDYQNDIILPDVYVSPSHLKLEQDSDSPDRWKLEDCDSHNGYTIKRHSKETTDDYMQSGDEFVIGHTRLRVLSPSHPVADTHIISSEHLTKQLINNPWFGIIILILTILTLMINSQLSTTAEVSIEKLIARSLPVIIGILFWAGVWAFVGRIIIHKTNFIVHFSITCLFTISLSLIDTLGEYVTFYSNSSLFSQSIEIILSGIIMIGLLLINLEYATAIKNKTRLIISHSVTWGFLTFATFTNFANQPDFSHSTKFPTVLKPPHLQLYGSKNIDTFLTDSEHIFSIEIPAKDDNE